MTREILLFLCLTFSAATCLPSTENKNAQADGPFAFSFKKPGEKAVIPFQRAGDHLVAPVRINNQEAGWFLLDTGAYCNLIDTAVAKRFNLPELGQWSIAGIGGANKAMVCKVDSLSLGEVELQNHSLSEYDISPLSKSLGVDLAGILGAFFWCQLPFTLDYHTSTITFYSRESFQPPTGARAEELKLGGGRPAVKCRLNGKHEAWFLLDSGASGHVSIEPLFVKQHPDLFEGKSQSTGLVGGIVGIEKHSFTKLASFEIFGVARPDVEVSVRQEDEGPALWETPPDLSNWMVGLVGEGILGDHRLTFDYMNLKMWIEKPPEQKAKESSNHQH